MSELAFKRMKTDSKGQRKKEPGRMSRFIRKAGRTARSVAFAAALPITAALMGGCDYMDCQTYNKTTIELNRETDGKVEKVEKLAEWPANGYIDEALIDFVNETHALSTAGMPSNLKVTWVDENCNGGCSGYAIAESAVDGERGVYLKSPVVFETICILNHEIGHLQPGGRENEVMAQINALEQNVIGYVLMATQESEGPLMTAETVFYSYKNENSFGNILTGTRELIESGDLTATNKYDVVDIYIAMRLVELDGNFEALREEVRALEREGRLNSEVDEYNSRFAEKYGDYEGMFPIADFEMEFKAALFEELDRRFGGEISRNYLEAESKFTFTEDWDYIMINGLESMECWATYEDEILSEKECEDTLCEAFGATNKDKVRAHFCCYQPTESEDGEVEIERLSVIAKGIRFSNSDGYLLEIGRGVYANFLYDVEPYTQTKLEDGELCF